MRILCALIFCISSAAAEQQRLYIGTYSRGDSVSEGIYTCLMDDQTGSLSDVKLAASADNPSFLAVDSENNLLFACNEVGDYQGADTGAVSAYRIDRATGELSLINQQPTGGAAPCHCIVDATKRFLLVANYTGGNISVFPIGKDGTLAPHSCLINHIGNGPNRQRQEKAHAHSINLSADNRFAYVADLGIDRVMIYRFDSQDGRLVPNSPDAATVTPGGGPRHFAIHPSARFAYCNNELTSEAVCFARNTKNGGLTRIQSLSTLPKDFSGRKSTAECLVDPSGRHLYVSNRGHDSIAVFAIDQKSGELSLVEITKTNGQEPRNFLIHPNGRFLLAENQKSDSVIVFRINPDTGGIKATNSKVSVGRPVCMRFLK